MTEIFEKTVDLLEKLTGREVPEDLLGFLDKFNQQEEKPKAKTRIQNFKHKKFAQYYRNLDLKLKSANMSATSQANILAALRQQLTATALDSKKLRKKANNLPVYRPVTKIDRENFRSYYKAKIQKMMESGSNSPLSSDVKKNLHQELQSSLTDQLGNVQAKLELKKTLELSAKMKLQKELRKSLQQQLVKVLPRFRNQA